MNQTEKPKIAIINNLARAGGTMINRCIGSMQDIIMFSEIHPTIYKERLLQQAQDWFELLPNTDPKSDWEFYDILSSIQKECTQKSKFLVIRDWSHVDYMAQPFVNVPVNRNVLMHALKSQYDVQSIAIIRHPIDQWLSLNSLTIFHEKKMLMAPFLDGYLAFLKSCCGTGSTNTFIRYEDIIADPDRMFAEICKTLAINYDQGYKQKWFNYENVTGDIHKGGRGYGRAEIVPMPRKPIAKESINRFLVQPKFKEILKLTGYSV